MRQKGSPFSYRTPSFHQGNAGKFSKPGSFVDLTVSLIQKPSPKAGTASNEGKTIRFSVKDYGKGIRKEDFKKIFQPFSQASKETQHLYGGTGMWRRW